MTPSLTSNDDRVKIGRGTYASGDPLLRPHHPGNKIIIGNYCSLAQDVTIFAGGNHPMNYVTSYPIKHFLCDDAFENWSKNCQDAEEETRVGNDVWLGYKSIVLSGASIGDGAGAVVRGEVPPYAIVSGNPAVVIRYRFDQATIDQLLRIRWWDWPEDKILVFGQRTGLTEYQGVSQ